MTTLLALAAARSAPAPTPGNRARCARITAPVRLAFLRENDRFAPVQ